MYYFLAHVPKIDFTSINKVREKYDPNYKFLDPHIAVVFPLDNSISEQTLITHIQNTLITEKSFDICIKGLAKSWDHYLYLEIDNGMKQIIHLHDKLYSGLLEKYWFKDIQYKPHITLGFFADRQAKFDLSDIDKIMFYKDKYHSAESLAEELNLEYVSHFDRLSLIKREDKLSSGIIVKEFKLHD